MPHRLGITLFFCFTLISLLASHASATLHAEPYHKRLLRKRVPQLFPDPAGTDTPTPTQVSSSTPATTITTPTGGVSTTTSQASSVSSSSTSNTASTSLSSTASSSSISTSSHTSATFAPTLALSPPNLGNAGASTPLPRLQTQTETVGGASPSSTASSVPDGASTSQQKVTLTVIIIIASSVGGIAILWTVFRKWKLGRSSRFDERLQPIEWKPPVEEPKLRRLASNASSFHSGGGGHDLGSDHGHEHGPGNLTPLPEHDFTALPSSRFGGYAEMARGPSPQPPQMLETYGHGPAAGYDVNVPLHHQAGYGGREYTNYNNAPMRY